MARHEFGIMEEDPLPGKRYDDYEPEKYHCISVDDVFLENVAASFDPIDFYWHTLDVKGKGLAYCGVTLIPPQSMDAFVRIVQKLPGLSELTALAESAKRSGK